MGVLGSGRGSNFVALTAAVAEGKVAAEFVVVGSDQADAKILEEAKQRGIPTVVCPKGKYRTKLEEEIEEGLAEQMVKAGVELAFETMTDAGIKAESAYYESLHEVPLIANLISRKKLYEMNKVISDTAEYGCYLFDNASRPLLKGFMAKVETDIIGKGLTGKTSNARLNQVNELISNHPVEHVGKKLRGYMTAMKAIVA